MASVSVTAPNVWVIAAAPTAFIGWTGKAVLYTRPMTIRLPPKASRMPGVYGILGCHDRRLIQGIRWPGGTDDDDRIA